MSAIQGRPGDDAATAGRCVVLSPAGSEAVSQALVTALNRRGMTVVLVGDPPRAMLELARYGALALIVAEPDRVRGAAELVEAVRVYRPRTVCWQYCDRQLTPINGHLGGVRLSAGRAESGSEPGPVAPVEREDRLRADQQRLSGLVVQAEPRDAGCEPLVSGEELAMLLGEVPEGTDEGT